MYVGHSGEKQCFHEVISMGHSGAKSGCTRVTVEQKRGCTWVIVKQSTDVHGLTMYE
jgi:hypothetical protein